MLSIEEDLKRDIKNAKQSSVSALTNLLAKLKVKSTIQKLENSKKEENRRLDYINHEHAVRKNNIEEVKNKVETSEKSIDALLSIYHFAKKKSMHYVLDEVYDIFGK